MNDNMEKYQEENKKYIEEHKHYVELAYDWLKKNSPQVFNILSSEENKELIENIKNHDASKYSEEEFEPYAKHFFGINKGKKEDPDFDAAWKHHYTVNKHHPQFWDGKDMPNVYILEMICDWMSFSLKNNNIQELFAYYNNQVKNNKDSDKKLSPKTVKTIENILKEIKLAKYKY